jgi:hypothetical protein
MYYHHIAWICETEFAFSKHESARRFVKTFYRLRVKVTESMIVNLFYRKEN